jgi:hypothetical protein
MESFKQNNEKKRGEMRPHGGYKSKPLKIIIPIKKEVEEEDEDPITPGSIHSAWPGWYKYPFPYVDEDYIPHFQPREEGEEGGEYYLDDY